MQFSYSLILPYFIQVYLISLKFIMVSYERFTDSLSKYRYGNLFPDSSTHTPCDFHTARTLSGSLCRKYFRLIYFYRQLLYPAIWKTDLTIFLHQRMDFTPKDRKTGSQKVKRDFVKKSALLYHISGEKTRPNNYTKH